VLTVNSREVSVTKAPRQVFRRRGPQDERMKVWGRGIKNNKKLLYHFCFGHNSAKYQVMHPPNWPSSTSANLAPSETSPRKVHPRTNIECERTLLPERAHARNVQAAPSGYPDLVGLTHVDIVT
jgi:hypothetical protein